MERTLSLVLDDEGKISLTLMKDDAVKIDDFTTKKFENSEQIREYFKKQIDEFLEKNKNYIDSVSKKIRKKFRGRIVILEAQEKNSEFYLIEKKVLYKKHLVVLKEIIKDKLTMLKFLELEKIGYNKYGFRKLISPFLSREIKYANFKIKSRVNLIKREIKKDKNNFYDILRIIIKAYEIERKKRNLKTIDSIYTSLQRQKENDLEKFVDVLPPKDFYLVEGTYYLPDEIPYDLDDLIKMDTEFKPDGLGPDERSR